MPSNFWNNPTVEPKRAFRFLLSISTFAEGNWLVKTADRPKASVSSVPHQYLNHTFNYPGRLVWNPVSITMVDPGDSFVDTTRTVRDFYEIAGYRNPAAGDGQQRAASALIKQKATGGSLGKVFIRTLNSTAGTGAVNLGASTYQDEWTLHNAFVQGDIDFGSLDYGSEELLTITFSLQYDWATLDKAGKSGHKDK
tara:strand:+ start:6327 stop:6914 length:588 start_codon:yes stop_codon:yes gene_type:complete